MKKNEQEIGASCRLGRVGGEAVIEGVMMRAGNRYSLATRMEDGSIKLSDHEYHSLRKKNKFFNIPLVRGVVSLIESFKLSFHVLSLSAEALGIDESEPETKFEKWLQKTFGDKLMNFIMGIAGVLGVALGLFLFLFLPSLAAKGVAALLGLIGVTLPAFAFSLIEGVFKMLIFISYMLLVSQMKDIRRTFEYHGAEHKSIACYESGDELTPENAAKHTRFHPRCGTSFIFVMLFISILIAMLPFVPTENLLLRLAIKLPLIPVICGLGFEFILYAGKHDNKLTRVLSAPGLWMQRITTREPDLSQLEIAITALKSAMPEEFDHEQLLAFVESTKPQPETPAEAETEAQTDADASTEAVEPTAPDSPNAP
ncbi:MAG: DUF1385 domain-containing protein [Clostridia bacterium]|nr:DUF1385 domain-containing protein [Clostridia bacterium]